MDLMIHSHCTTKVSNYNYGYFSYCPHKNNGGGVSVGVSNGGVSVGASKDQTTKVKSLGALK